MFISFKSCDTLQSFDCSFTNTLLCNNVTAPPVVSNVCVVELFLGKYSGERGYFGGYEGASLFSWYRETNDGTVILINGATSRTYEVTDKDYNCRLLFG